VSKRTKQQYTTEFRENAVNLVISSDKSIAQIARDLGINGTTLYAWIGKAKSSTIQAPGKSNEQLFDELKKVKKELAEVKEQRDILKKATAYFAKESR
jgi:transposase